VLKGSEEGRGEPSRDNEGQQDGLVNKGVWVFCFVFWFLWFFETGFLCVALAVLELNFVDQAGLELRNLPASASQDQRRVPPRLAA
jgi:hypothetical protein